MLLDISSRQWHPTPVLLPGKSHEWRSLVGCSPWGSLRVGHDWATSLSLFTFMHWRMKWQPTPVFLPGESQGWQSLVGSCLWGRTVGHDWSDLAAAFLIVWNLFSSSLPLQHAKHCIREPRQCLNTCPHLHALHLGSHQWCAHEKWTIMDNHSSQDASKGGKTQPSGKMGN